MSIAAARSRTAPPRSPESSSRPSTSSIGSERKYVYGSAFWMKAETPATSLAVDVRDQLRWVDHVAAQEDPDGGDGVEARAVAGLELRVGVDATDDAGVEAGAGGEGEQAAVDLAEVDPARVPVVGDAQQVLRGVDDVAADAEHPRVDVGRAARQAREWRVGAGEAVGGLVDRAVPAEGDHHVVALAGCLAAELRRVPGALRVDRLDLVAALERVDDQVLQPVGHRRRVRVDDDQHPLHGGGCRQRGGALEPGEVVGAY